MPDFLELARLASRASAPVVFVPLVAIIGLGACSGSSDGGDGIAADDGLTGGASTGGASTGGASTGGASTGGALTGGASTGGASTGGNAGSGGTDEGCPGGCGEGTCFQALDGTWSCVTRPSDVPRETCEAFDTMCCSEDSECTEGSNGRCISNIATYNGCGGAIPFGNACHYDVCTTDADCPPLEGAEVAVCVPPGALNATNSICVYGGCRTDADCTTHADGRCLYGEAQTHGTCARRKVFFCAYPSDPCGGTTNTCSPPLVCLPEDSYDGRICSTPSPMYP